MPVGLCQPPGAASTMPASAAAVEHLEEMRGSDFMVHSQPKENGTADWSFQHELPCRVTKVELRGHMKLLSASAAAAQGAW